VPKAIPPLCDYCSVTPAALRSFESLQTTGTQCMKALISHSSLCSRWKSFKRKKKSATVFIFFPERTCIHPKNKDNTCQDIQVCCVSFVLVFASGVLDSTHTHTQTHKKGSDLGKECSFLGIVHALPTFPTPHKPFVFNICAVFVSLPFVL